jgi:hypothetical protein
MYLTNTCDQVRAYYRRDRRWLLLTVSAAVLTEEMRHIARTAENYIFSSKIRTHARIDRAPVQGYYEYMH